MSGELKKWHKIILTFDGPYCSESGDPNPFADYKLSVTFSQNDQVFVVPGHFAADGKAAYTSSDKGNKWRVYFSPNRPGKWDYRVSFKHGNGIAVSDDEGISAGYMDGESGSFIVERTDKKGRDFRAHGRLNYVGEHYLQHAETGRYFIKCGADAPENFLAYYEIDNTPNVSGLRKTWEDHARDFIPDANEYLWGENRQDGKNILGAINYLSGKGMNAFSFLTFNVDGDDKNVFPHLLKISIEEYEKEYEEDEKAPGKIEYVENDTEDDQYYKQWEEFVIHDRFDVSKLDQWEQIFSYAESKGMFLHFKTQETENDHKMDGGELGPERKLYYRELISRFGHHLGLNWNLGEENTQNIENIKKAADFFAENDPYENLVVLHTYPGNTQEMIYRPLIGNQSNLTGISLQTDRSDFSGVHSAVNKWIKASAESGKKWVVACDEPGDAIHSLLPDEEDPDHNNARINGLWGTLMAGGCGTEWYFGYEHAHSDLTCQSWRSRDLFWDQCKIALDFFNQNEIPISEMQCMDALTKSEDDYVFAKPGEVYLIYTKSGESIDLNIPAYGYKISWLNPRTGKSKGIDAFTTGRQFVIDPPTTNDWLLYVVKSNESQSLNNQSDR